MTVSPEQLLAYVDGEASQEEAARIEAALAADPALMAELERHMRLSTRLSAAYDPVLAEPIPERLVAAVAAQDAKIVDFAARRGRRFGAPQWAAMAACLALGVGIGVFGPQQGLVSKDMVAQGPLAAALDDSLAADGGAVRIGVSFKAQGGGYCRSFQVAQQGLAGLACHEDGGWKVRTVAVTEATDDTAYRQASSLPPAVAAAVDATMAGAPLDAAGEARARAAGWR